jgi:hypothetical protein
MCEMQNLSFRQSLAWRLAPFLALLDARYLPLLFAGAPQSYAVYRWLADPKLLTGQWDWIALLGALGFEMVYVGAIAWSDQGVTTGWTWVTAIAALVFAVLVAVVSYWPTQGVAALLHAGFPIVAFCYTLQMHAASRASGARPQGAAEATPSATADAVPAALTINVTQTATAAALALAPVRIGGRSYDARSAGVALGVAPDVLTGRAFSLRGAAALTDGRGEKAVRGALARLDAVALPIEVA